MVAQVVFTKKLMTVHVMHVTTHALNVLVMMSVLFVPVMDIDNYNLTEPVLVSTHIMMIFKMPIVNHVLTNVIIVTFTDVLIVYLLTIIEKMQLINVLVQSDTTQPELQNVHYVTINVTHVPLMKPVQIVLI